jgi:hypothetical protein
MWYEITGESKLSTRYRFQNFSALNFILDINTIFIIVLTPTRTSKNSWYEGYSYGP